MSTELTRFDTAYGPVELSGEMVKKYLAKGQNFTDQEVKMFIELCKYQKLNPFVNEAYLIKFGNECQMIVGYSTYVRRAEEFPEYVRKEDGITVMRGSDIVQKPGQCLYPGEKLIGGWCIVYKLKNGVEMSCGLTEVQLEEYIQKKSDGTPNTNWKNKPATMIHKVAVSQALRAAFPKDNAGLYIQEEFQDIIPDIELLPEKDDPVITQEQRQALFSAAKSKFGAKWKDEFKVICTETTQLNSTTGMKVSQFSSVMKAIIESKVPETSTENQPASETCAESDTSGETGSSDQNDTSDETP
jgi:phage recombination protein Bet